MDGPADETAHPGAMALRDAMRPLREHLPFIIVFVLSAMLSALALTYIYSERYRAGTTIFFRPSEVTLLTQHTTQALGSPYPSNTAYKAVDQTISQMLTSGALLRQVVTDLHLEVPKPHDLSGPWYVHYYKEAKFAVEDFVLDAWKILKWGRIIDDPVGAAVARLRSSLKVTSTDSYVYDLTVAADTPAGARQITDDVAARLVGSLRRLDLRGAAEQEQRLAKLLAEKARQVENIEAQIRDLLSADNVASLPDELTEATRRASHFQTARADATADLRESEGKLAELTARLHILAPAAANAGREPTQIGAPSRLTPTDYARLSSQKLDAQVRLRGLSAKLAATERSSAAANARLQALGTAKARYDFVSARLAAAKRDFAALNDAHEEAVIKATTDQSQLHVEAEATAPPEPISPIKIYHVGAAGLLALIIALGFAYVLDYFEIRLFLPPPDSRRARRLAAARMPAASPESAAARVVLD